MLKEINLDNDEVAVIAAMTYYLYSDDYDNTGADRSQNIFPATSGPFVFKVKMCIAAGVYNIPVLHALATGKLGSAWDDDAFMEAQKLVWGKANGEVIKEVLSKRMRGCRENTALHVLCSAICCEVGWGID